MSQECLSVEKPESFERIIQPAANSLKPGLAATLAASPATKATPIQWRHVVILGGLGAFGPLAIDMYLPSLPDVSRDLGASMSITQLTLSATILGLSLGQVVAGPLSDALGRKRPLLVGVGLFILLSLLCIVAPSMSVLIPLRFFQGVVGAAGIALALAIASDIYTGVSLARTYALLLMITGVAPIIAPVIGGQILNFISWRGIFGGIAIIAAIFFLASLFGLEESLPREKRQPLGFGPTFAAFRTLLGDRRFVGYALSVGLAFACPIVYVSVSPFVLQNLYGLSPQLFSLLFSLSALGLISSAQLSNWLAGKVTPRKLLTVGIVLNVAGGVGMFLAVISGLGLVGVLVSFLLITASMGLIVPNATTLALSNTTTAGSASALLGVIQFTTGAVAGPLVGLAGTGTAIPMTATIAGFGVATALSFVFLTRTESTDVLAQESPAPF
ncbi:MAG: multidrug effflux MFS transporter [Chloroflexi bacterium]|nr:multidrug effflux MFS transporter [Chloroflexota bacterium]